MAITISGKFWLLSLRGVGGYVAIGLKTLPVAVKLTLQFNPLRLFRLLVLSDAAARLVYTSGSLRNITADERSYHQWLETVVDDDRSPALVKGYAFTLRNPVLQSVACSELILKVDDTPVDPTQVWLITYDNIRNLAEVTAERPFSFACGQRTEVFVQNNEGLSADIHRIFLELIPVCTRATGHFMVRDAIRQHRTRRG